MDALTIIVLVYFAIGPLTAGGIRNPWFAARVAQPIYGALQRLGLQQSWQLFTGTELQHTWHTWLRFHFVNGSYDDEYSILRSLPAPHRVYVQTAMSIDAEHRDAVLGAILAHVELGSRQGAPSRLSIMRKTRVLSHSGDGLVVQEVTRELASVDLEVEELET